MSAQSRPVLTLTRQAAGAVQKRRYVGVNNLQATVAGQAILGVSRSDAALGADMPVDVIGTTIIETGAAVPEGPVMADAQGRAIAFTGAVGTHRGGIALEASTGAGEFIEVLIERGETQ